VYNWRLAHLQHLVVPIHTTTKFARIKSLKETDTLAYCAAA
jgi:hypothetical protein